MQAPFLSFLTAFEQALVAAEPEGVWHCSRSVSYGQGVAQMIISLRQAKEESQRGHLTLQSYRLSDGTFCLKATLNWQGTEQTRVRTIYSKPDLNWNDEAKRLATDWQSGPVPGTAATAAQS